MTKEKLTKIKFYNTSKEGQPLLDKNSRPYTRVNIQTAEHGATWMSGLAYQDSPVMQWKEGMEIEIETKQNGQYTNFDLPKKQAGQNPQVLRMIYDLLKKMDAKLDMLTVGEENEPEPPTDGIGEPPF